ncbi:MAG TPA: hypothetical protein VH249_22875 [Xanthobacteraceae bacterium]|jgi:hypothetical protein|nr:hypothetical protein [Xanthobacteraceae bacterium]
MVVLVVALGLGSFGLSASAFARASGLEESGFGGDHAASGFDGRRDGGSYRAESGGVSGLRRGTHGRPDVWGHWGAYDGPMIPPI